MGATFDFGTAISGILQPSMYDMVIIMLCAVPSHSLSIPVEFVTCAIENEIRKEPAGTARLTITKFTGTLAGIDVWPFNGSKKSV